MKTLTSTEYYSTTHTDDDCGEIAQCAQCGHESDIMITDDDEDDIAEYVGECPQCGREEWMIRRA